MAKQQSRFERARSNFAAAGKDTAHKARTLVCGIGLPDGSSCPATGLYIETFRRKAYHFKGTCEAGHELERFGYAEREVVD